MQNSVGFVDFFPTRRARALFDDLHVCARRALVPLTTNIKNLTTSRDFTPRGARARILSEASA